jgi:hypothetical protein
MWIVGEECPTVGLQTSSPHQVFCCAMCFREVVENVVLGFKDQSKGNDDASRDLKSGQCSMFDLLCALRKLEEIV